MRYRCALIVAAAAAIGFVGGLIASSGHVGERGPFQPPTPGPTVSVPWRQERFPVVLEGKALPRVKGRFFHTGNIHFPVFPVEPVVTAVTGRATPVKVGLELQACGRSVTVRWMAPGRQPRIQVTGRAGTVAPRPRWPLRAGEFDHPRPLDPLAGIWLYKGQAMASADWMWQVVGIHTEFLHKGLVIRGCLLPDGSPVMSPAQTIRAYFKASAARNRARCMQLLTEHRRRNGLPWCADDNLASIRLLGIHEPLARREAEYRETHLGVFAVRVLPVTYEVTFRQERSMPSGRHTWAYFLVREQADSPWQIADWGH